MKIVSLLIVAVFIAIVAAFAFAQHDHSQHSGTSPKTAMPMMDMEKCQKDMKEGEARLAKLVAKMDTAKGQEKTEAVAETVKEMISQEKAMHQMCMSMMQNMHGQMKPMMGEGHHGG